MELGPAHTRGDTIVHVPDAGTVFTGDLLFIEGTPIVWASLGNWISACDRIIELGATVLVPGHGPVTDASGVSDVRRYLRFVQDAARERFEAGMSPSRGGRRHRNRRFRRLERPRAAGRQRHRGLPRA